MTLRRISTYVLLLFVCIRTVYGAIYSGFTVGRQFEYIGKFCFTYKPTLDQVAGQIEASIQTDIPNLKLAIYDDEDMFWNYIMSNKSCGCECKIAPQHTKSVIEVKPVTADGLPFTFTFDIHQHLRPRFWYVALAHCVPGGDEYEPSIAKTTEENFHQYYFSAWYDIHMTQADGSELPVQQQGLPLLYGLMTLLSGVAAIAQFTAARRSSLSESFHPIMQLLTLIVFFYGLSHGLYFVHFWIVGFNGTGIPLFKYASQILEVFVRVGTVLLAMLMAKGWTINSVTLEGQEKLSCLMVAILALYLSMAMWYLVWLDPASTLYIYESWPGVAICLLHLLVLAWFMNTVLETRSIEEATAKRRFFIQIAFLFFVYLLSLPIIVVIASVLSPWVREKIVMGVSDSIDLGIYVALIYLLWPSRAPRYFERLYSVSSSEEKATLRDQTLPTEEL